ncbi:MAG TPA: tryptophan tryptophylquinone biosynthesis enzyme MauG, partial [Gammaproteobacteria bacterium]|nr:tryptophan tryptophylquinone biosynthesis enzyme MauG [Gammaproteobacteria bacterium]
KPIGLMKGAFKTPTLRDITLTAPYFHDGSAATLMDVVNHYETGGSVKTNLSPNMKALQLTPAEKNDLVAFMKALTTPPQAFTLPVIPPNNF